LTDTARIRHAKVHRIYSATWRGDNLTEVNTILSALGHRTATPDGTHLILTCPESDDPVRVAPSQHIVINHYVDDGATIIALDNTQFTAIYKPWSVKGGISQMHGLACKVLIDLNSYITVDELARMASTMSAGEWTYAIEDLALGLADRGDTIYDWQRDELQALWEFFCKSSEHAFPDIKTVPKGQSPWGNGVTKNPA
jgi:hypothetical protein